jgi:DNA mismatch endonuclease (patch repair protein)
MAAIRGTNTKPELLLRKELFRRGLRYRLHDRRLPGRPDLVFPRYQAAVFVHGCFFHGHECPAFRWPASRAQFWREKIEANRRRDLAVDAGLASAGWRRLVVWECALMVPRRHDIRRLGADVSAWIRSPAHSDSIAGKDADHA